MGRSSARPGRSPTSRPHGTISTCGTTATTAVGGSGTSCSSGSPLASPAGPCGRTSLLLEQRPDRLAALDGRVALCGHDDLRLLRLLLDLAARLPDGLALGVRGVEADELVDGLAVADRARERGEHRRGAERLRVRLRERRERGLLGKLVPRDLHVLLARDLVEDEERLCAPLGQRQPFLPQLVLGLPRLQKELLERKPLLFDAGLQVGHEVLELLLHEDLGQLDSRRLEGMRDGLLRGVVARLVERGVGELVADRLAERGVRPVVAEHDLGAYDHRRGVPKRLALRELRDLDLGLIDRIEVLRGDDLAVGLVDEVGPGVIPEMLLPIRPLVHRARRLARAETRDLRALHVPLKGRVRGAGEPTGVDFRLDDHCRAGLAPDRVADGRGYGLRRFVHGRAQVYWVRLHAMFYYEIHDGDEDLGTAVLLAHEQHFEPAEFFALVKKARTLLLDAYEEDSLSEAIANELARTEGFVHVTDDLLIASVNVDEAEERTFLVDGGDRPN